jgi:hypothetical protein
VGNFFEKTASEIGSKIKDLKIKEKAQVVVNKGKEVIVSIKYFNLKKSQPVKNFVDKTKNFFGIKKKPDNRDLIAEEGKGNQDNDVEYVDQQGGYSKDNNNDLIFQHFQHNQKQNYNIYNGDTDGGFYSSRGQQPNPKGDNNNDLISFGSDNNQPGSRNSYPNLIEIGNPNLIDITNNNSNNSNNSNSNQGNTNLIDLSPQTKTPNSNPNLIDF